MVHQQQVVDALYLAVDEVNRMLPPGARLQKSESTPILGPDASLDSLGFVNLVLAVETKVNETCERRVNLAEHLMDSSDQELPGTLGALGMVIAELQQAGR